jgi:hypothetical protein
MFNAALLLLALISYSSLADCPTELGFYRSAITTTQSEFDPARLVKPRIELARVHLRLSQPPGCSLSGQLWYKGEMIGNWEVSDTGAMSTKKLNLGPKTRYGGTGLGTLCYLIAAVETYDRQGVLLRSDIPTRPAEDVWRRLTEHGLARQVEPGAWMFNISALADDRLDAIRSFVRRQGSYDEEIQ